jgi:hypothetical protein
LKEMEELASRTAPVAHSILAKWRLEALASRVQSHFAHLHSPFAVANCALCKTSTAGRTTIMHWALTVALAEFAAVRSMTPPPMPVPMSAVRASDHPSHSWTESTMRVSPASPLEFMIQNFTPFPSPAQLQCQHAELRTLPNGRYHAAQYTHRLIIGSRCVAGRR